MNVSDPTPPSSLLDLLDKWQRIVCVGHVTPDADCLGSLLAVARTWAEAGRRALSVALPPGALSQKLGFLADWAAVPVAGADDCRRADGFVVVDTAQQSRCNVPAEWGPDWSAGRPLLNIDHHETNTGFGMINWVVGKAASSSELIYQMIRAAGRTVDEVTASLLYAGVFSDTSGFSLPSTTSLSLRVAADLVERGANVAELGERLERSRRRSEFDLVRTIYANTRLTADGRIAYSTADHAEITGAGCTAADIDDQVMIPRSLHGIRMAILFTEGVRGRTRLNFRGEQGLNVLELARQFNGGGHAHAAGAILDCPLAEAVNRVLPAAEAALNGQDDAGLHGRSGEATRHEGE